VAPCSILKEKTVNKSIKTLLSAVFVSSVIGSAAYAAGVDYIVGEDMHTINKVSFSSKATLTSITGTTSNIAGNAKVDMANLTKSTGEIKVNLTSLDTGVARRNEHMQGVINSAENPFATFKLKKINTNIKSLPAYKPVFVNASGDITLNKITKPVNTVLELTYMPEKDKNFREGNWIHMVTSFDLKLSDHGIVAPKLIPMKVNDVVKINVDVMGQQK
jgi:polyisoprenoid-binding protein YceI